MPKPSKKLQADQVVVGQKNRFAALDNFSTDSDSDSEFDSSPVKESVREVVPTPLINQEKKPDFREFTVVNKRGGKQVSTDMDGWTSIQWSKPQFVDSDTESVESETQIKKELEQEALECDIEYVSEEVAVSSTSVPDLFPSLLNRGSINTVAWAEKIKQSLEKAEITRKNPVAPGIKPTEDFVSGLGGISFFGPKA